MTDHYTITVSVKGVTGKEPTTPMRGLPARRVPTAEGERPTRDVADVGNFTVRGSTIELAVMRAKAALDVIVMEES